jgi:cytochrome c biogenesis protein CcmG/thiol:disulfide interchange protein DsbE
MDVRRSRTTLRAVIVLLLLAATSGCAGEPPSTITTGGPASEASTAAEYQPVRARGVQSCSELSMIQGATGGDQGLPALKLPCLVPGPPVNLARLGGKPVLINLWATWCGPCREEMPILQSAHVRHGDRIEFLGIDTKDNPEIAATFLQEVGVTYPQVVDLDGRLLVEHLRLPGLPVTVVLDSDGKVFKTHVGAFSEESLDSLIHELL